MENSKLENPLDSSSYRQCANRIHYNLNAGKIIFEENHPDDTIFHYLNKKMINYAAENQTNYNITSLKRIFSSKDIFPPMQFLIGYCDVMDVDFQTLVYGNLSPFKNQSIEEDISLLSKKFTSNNLNIFFPASSSSDDNIIHEAKLHVIRTNRKNIFNVRFSIDLKDNNKEFEGDLVVYSNNKTATISVTNVSNPDDYMFFSFYNMSLAGKYFGTLGFRLGVSSSDPKVPCFTKCILSESSIKNRKDPTVAKWAQGLLSISNNTVTIARDDYERIYKEINLSECSGKLGYSKIKPLEIEPVVCIDFENIISLSNLSREQKKKIRKLINLVKSESLAPKSLTISALDNELACKFLKHIDES